jgi:hypothetical protein
MTCVQLLFSDIQLVEETYHDLREGRYGRDFDEDYADITLNILQYIYREGLDRHVFALSERQDVVAIVSQHPDRRPWPERPTDMINEIINLINVDCQMLERARRLTPVVRVDGLVEGLITLVLDWHELQP